MLAGEKIEEEHLLNKELEKGSIRNFLLLPFLIHIKKEFMEV